ncbi:prefoldin subunit beta [Candidatus Woesearchaeota archaeon]|nr:prefoldin subunit beta [Candidatus Woesearchaeota archaeon]
MAEKETENKIEQLQLLEQNIQALLVQKQNFQNQLLEIENSLDELSRIKDKPYKIIGPIMVLTEKEELKKELESKKEVLDLRIKSIEKQENETRNRFKILQEEIIKELKH